MIDKKFITNLMSSVRMPVGKYRGQDLYDVMESDPGYIEWISQQEWFRQQHPQVYKNVLQARFLDETMRNALADWYLPEFDVDAFVKRELANHRSAQREYAAKALEKHWCRKVTTQVSTTGPVFEALGIDVSFSCRRHVSVRGVGKTVIEDEGEESELNIEVKPTVGDDYPTVLRQILAARARYWNRIVTRGVNDYAYPGMRGGIASVRAAVEHSVGPAENINGFVLVVENYTGSCVPVEQVRNFFEAQNISFALLSDI